MNGVFLTRMKLEIKKYRQRFSFFSTCDERESLRLNGNSCALNMLLNVPVPKDIKNYQYGSLRLLNKLSDVKLQYD